MSETKGHKFGNIYCTECKKPVYFTDTPTEKIDHIILEQERTCDNCDNVIDRYDSGYWEVGEDFYNK